MTKDLLKTIEFQEQDIDVKIYHVMNDYDGDNKFEFEAVIAYLPSYYLTNNVEQIEPLIYKFSFTNDSNIDKLIERIVNYQKSLGYSKVRYIDVLNIIAYFYHLTRRGLT